MADQLLRVFWNSSERGMLELGVIDRESLRIMTQAEWEEHLAFPRKAELFTQQEYEELCKRFDSKGFDSTELLPESDLSVLDPFVSILSDGDVVVRISAGDLDIVAVRTVYYPSAESDSARSF